MACWDIVAKVCGQPLVSIFGGRVRNEVEFFYYLSQQSPAEMAADAAHGANFLLANQSYASFLRDDIVADASPLPYESGRLRVPTEPGIGIRLDRERVEKYADLYRAGARNFAFAETEAMVATPLLPKR